MLMTIDQIDMIVNNSEWDEEKREWKVPTSLTGKRTSACPNSSPNKSPKTTFKPKNRKKNSISEPPSETTKRNHPAKTDSDSIAKSKRHVECLTNKWATTGARPQTS